MNTAQLKAHLKYLENARSEHFAAQLELDTQIKETFDQLQEIYRGDFPVKRFGKVVIDQSMPDYPYPIWWGRFPVTVMGFLENGDISISGICGRTSLPRQYLLPLDKE